MIGIVDYGLGNVKAFIEIFRRLNVPAILIRQPGDLENAQKLILPGVGSFDNAMNLLQKSGMTAVLSELVIDRRIPVLGVCVGMQILGNSSEEGVSRGLGWIRGVVKKIDFDPGQKMKYIPHMGWNTIEKIKDNKIFEGLDSDARFYFLHSYVFDCDSEDDVLAVTYYGQSFTCVINCKNIYGVQFHPEKSHKWGVQLLKNFSEI